MLSFVPIYLIISAPFVMLWTPFLCFILSPCFPFNSSFVFIALHFYFGFHLSSYFPIFPRYFLFRPFVHLSAFPIFPSLIFQFHSLLLFSLISSPSVSLLLRLFTISFLCQVTLDRGCSFLFIFQPLHAVYFSLPFPLLD